MSLAENLQYLRAREGVTQEQLAERLDVSRQSVSKWESSASFPEMDTLIKLCDMFHTDMDTLLRGSVEQTLSEDTTGYDRFMTAFARKIASGVSAIIIGVAVFCLASLTGEGRVGMLCMAGFFLILTVAVVVFIASGIEEEQFRKQHPVIADFYTEKQKADFRRRFVWYIAGGVGAILFGLFLMILTFAFFPEQEPYETIAGTAFLLIVAGAVWFLVYGGMMASKYNIPEYNWENNPTPEDKAKRRRAMTACAVIMLLATALYLFLGLSYDKWETAAAIYPVAGILCGVAFVLLGPRFEE
ncbi:MAG: helix-turn-helix transcriptional regulator [Oscillibacter sp.]|nr:helix-turn-helix transcriptional regulator [Oscillibacter sp.]